VTANELGQKLIEYYRKVVEVNKDRRQKLAGKIDSNLLWSEKLDYPGIPISSLPKGLREEASVAITIVQNNETIKDDLQPRESAGPVPRAPSHLSAD